MGTLPFPCLPCQPSPRQRRLHLAAVPLGFTAGYQPLTLYLPTYGFHRRVPTFHTFLAYLWVSPQGTNLSFEETRRALCSVSVVLDVGVLSGLFAVMVAHGGGAASRHCEKFGATPRHCKGSAPLRNTAKVRCCFEALQTYRCRFEALQNSVPLRGTTKSSVLLRGASKIGAASRHCGKSG